MTHNHFFVYDRDASNGARYVSICHGCGDVKVTDLAPAPPLYPTVLPGVWHPVWPGSETAAPWPTTLPYRVTD